MKNAKRVLLSVAVLLCGGDVCSRSKLFAAESGQDRVIQFLDMKKKHLDRWFDYMKENNSARFDLLKKQHDQMFDAKIEHIKNFTGTIDWNQKLAMMLKMFEQHLQEWNAFAMQQHEKAGALYQEDLKTLADLKASAGSSQAVEDTGSED